MEKCGKSEKLNVLIHFPSKGRQTTGIVQAEIASETDHFGEISKDCLRWKSCQTVAGTAHFSGSHEIPNFFTGALPNLAGTHTFEQPIEAPSSTTALQQLTIHEVIALLIDLGDHFHIGSTWNTFERIVSTGCRCRYGREQRTI
jgi:hypothetical protein